MARPLSATLPHASSIQSIAVDLNRSLTKQVERQTSLKHGVATLDAIASLSAKSGLKYLICSNRSGCAKIQPRCASHTITSMRSDTQARIIRYEQVLHSSKAQRRYKRLEKRLEMLNSIEKEMSEHPHLELLGAMGWGEDCLIRLPRQRNVSQYDALLYRDRKTGMVSARYLDNQLLPMPEDNNRSRKLLKHTTSEVSTSEGKTLSWHSIETVLTEHKNAIHQNGGSAGTVGCCTQMSLDEITSAFSSNGASDSAPIIADDPTGMDSGEAVKSADGAEDMPMVDGHAHEAAMHHHSGQWIETPSSATDFAFLGGVGYVSIAGAYIGLNTIRGHYKQLVAELCHALDKSYRELNQLSIMSPDESTDCRATARENVMAKIVFCCRQLKEALFQLHAAGHLSGGASVAMFLGQFIPPLETIALAGNSLVGVAHIANSIRNVISASEDHALFSLETNTSGSKNRLPFFAKLRNRIARHRPKKTMPPKDANRIAQSRLRRKSRTNIKNILSWGLFTGGAATVTAVMLSALGVSIAFPPAALFLGLGLLIVGIMGTTRYNNRLTGNQYTPGLPRKIVNETMSEARVRSELENAHELLNQSRALIKSSNWTQRWMGPVKHWGRRMMRYKALTVLSIGTLSEALMGQKSIVKAIQARNTSVPHEEMVRYLSHFLPDQSVPLKKESHSHAQYCRELLSVAEVIDPEDDDIDDILLNRLTPQFAKLISQLALKEKSSDFSRIHFSLREGFKQTKPTIHLVLNAEFKALFPHLQNHPDGLNDLKTLKYAKPCCVYSKETQNVLKHLDLSSAENQALFEELLERYVLFQTKKDAKRELGLWTEYLASFASVKARNKIAA